MTSKALRQLRLGRHRFQRPRTRSHRCGLLPRRLRSARREISSRVRTAPRGEAALVRRQEFLGTVVSFRGAVMRSRCNRCNSRCHTWAGAEAGVTESSTTSSVKDAFNLRISRGYLRSAATRLFCSRQQNLVAGAGLACNSAAKLAASCLSSCTGHSRLFLFAAARTGRDT